MEGHKNRVAWLVRFFNVMHLILAQTVLYKQHYMKHNAMKLTFKVCLFGGNFWRQFLAAKRRPLVCLPKLNPSFSQNSFWFIYSKIFLFCIGMPENGNPCASIVVEGCPSSKKRDFWVPKKTQFLGPNFWRGKDCAPNWRRVFTQFRIFPLIGLNGEVAS